MPLIRDRCICLRKTEYSETSQIVTLLSREHGVVRAIAKGAHRRTKAGASKFDGGVDFLESGEAVFTFDPARELSTLTEWGLRDGHLGLRANLRGLYLALAAGELVDRLMELHDPHPALFDRLEATLPALATDRREPTFLAFVLDLLRTSGHLPELHQCAACGRPSALARAEREGSAGAAAISPAPVNADAASDAVSEGGSATEPAAIGTAPAVAPLPAVPLPVPDRPHPAFMSPALGGLVCPNCEAAVPDRQTIDGRLLRLVRGLLRLTADPTPWPDPADLPDLGRAVVDPVHRMLLDHVQHAIGRPLTMRRWVL